MSSKDIENVANQGQRNHSNTNLPEGKSPQEQLQQNVHDDISKILGSSGNKPVPVVASSPPLLQNLKQPSELKPTQPQSQQQRLISSASSGTLNAPQPRPQGQIGQLHSQQQQPTQPASRLSKYTRVRIIGRGAYGIVSLVRNLSGQYLAMKEVNQMKLRKDSKAHQAYMEKIVCSFSHPGIPQFHSCFRQGDKLYFIMAYVEGELLSMLIKKHIDLLTEPIIQFYIAEIVLTLEYIHSLGFSHRDMKAENLVLTKEGHIQLIDYGTLNDYCTQLIPPEALENVKAKDAHRRDRITAKKKSEIAKIFEEEERVSSNPRDTDGNAEHRGISKKIKDIKLNSEDLEDIERRIRCQTFCGTAEYLCPEMLEDQSCEMSGDLWALGCLIYKLFTNSTPFIDESQLLIFQRIKQGNYNKQHEKIPPAAQSLIDALLVLDSHSRLGSVIVDQHTTANSVHEAYSKLKAHPFFDGIKWESLYSSPPPQCVIDLLNTIRNPVFKANEPKDMNDFVDNSDDDDDDDDDFEDGFRNDQGYKEIQQKKNFEPVASNIASSSSKSQQSSKLPESPSKLALLRQSEGGSNALSKTQSSPLTENDVYQNNPQAHRKHTSETSSRQLTYIQMVSSFAKPFTLDNLFYQTSIIKVNKHLLLFSTKRPRQILLFDVDPITMIYYIPTKPNPTIKRVVLDNSVTIVLDSQKKIVFQDSIEKYIFEDTKGNSPALLYDAIERLKKKRANK